MSSSKSTSHQEQPLEVVVIGAGVIGIQVALGLAKRNIAVTLYDQASELKEISAGFGFTDNVVGCMRFLEPRLAGAVDTAGPPAEGSQRWVDGMTKEDIRAMRYEDVPGIKMAGEVDLHYCHRGQLLHEMVKLFPKHQIQLGKRLETIEGLDGDSKAVLRFVDGTMAQADIVIGCDGINSRVRRVVAAPESPSAYSHYAHESAFRCLVDYKSAHAALGQLAEEQVMFIGDNANIITYPVGERQSLNVAAFVKDDQDWPQGRKHAISVNKEEVVEAYSDFGPAVQALIQLLPDRVSRWAIFDTLDHPLASFVNGRIAVAGDAAHGSTPHHGAGAAMGIEDAAILVALIERVNTLTESDRSTVPVLECVTEALKIYDSVRRERAQWLVESSRLQGQIVKFLNPDIGRDFEKLQAHTRMRMSKIQTYDWHDVMINAVTDLENRFGKYEDL
ncbi:hypothetical protein PFICI_03615 [Pestalotiopsis fici W106-1]|uniref:FAD-binding domain-containing protein n=1 Tax=Pestalotiopsis fici (strain W106-1 / CGMCC3.15140) TaxID=1229662 RepID=W3XHT8_PESFW|nr:uncharacterized protein PFICI_03615 [Pestalotiopsis fici W106-1]ETS85590.1 hypothetical protein PFICI_03615 [Pestalotiopsis fici W106-1]